MPSPHAASRIFPRTAMRCAQLRLPRLDRGLCLTSLALMCAWIAQIIFWQIVGWQISFRMNLSWIALPAGAYFLASVAASIAAARMKFTDRLFPACLLACGWIALTLAAIVLGILNKSIFLFTLSAALLGAGLFLLLRQATHCLRREHPPIVLPIATLCGIAFGLAATNGTLFVNQHLLQLPIALACCLAIALWAMRIQPTPAQEYVAAAPGLAAQSYAHALASSIKYAGCGVLMAAPIAFAPIIETLCGARPAGLSYGFLAHYGAMLLPGLFGHEWPHTMFRYMLLFVYVTSLVVGHIFPLLYLSGIG
jgi:hypothetical protein